MYWTRCRNRVRIYLWLGSAFIALVPALRLGIQVNERTQTGSPVALLPTIIVISASLLMGTALIAVGTRLLPLTRASSPESLVARLGPPGKGLAFDQVALELPRALGRIPTADYVGSGRVFVTDHWIVALRGLRTEAMRLDQILEVQRHGDLGPVSTSDRRPVWISVRDASGCSFGFAVPAHDNPDGIVKALLVAMSGKRWPLETQEPSEGLLRPGFAAIDELDRFSAALLGTVSLVGAASLLAISVNEPVLGFVGAAAVIPAGLYLHRALRWPVQRAG